MSRILCATDFSDPSIAAREVAVDLARTLDARVELVHVLEGLPLDAVEGHPEHGAFAGSLAERAAQLEDAMRDARKDRLRAVRESIEARGVKARERILEGKRPWEALVEEAASGDTRLIVMGTHGRRGPARWLLGSVAERTVKGAPCPVLVVPKATAAFRHWTEGRRALRVAVGLDLGEDAPLAFVRTLRQAGPCDVTALHFYWPPAEMKRRGVTAPFDVDGPPEEIRQAVETGLRDTVGELPGKGSVSFHAAPEWGRVSNALLEESARRECDLLVVGNHGRHTVEGLASMSTSLGLLRHVERPVAFVPAEVKDARGSRRT